MANDNTLGAPTEGLGQTVTFTANGRGGVPQTSSTQRQSVRNNPGQGGARLTAQALQVPAAPPDPTFAALMKLGGELIKPHIEQARTEAYVKGMQKAAQGQAITDIVDEQPWYSKVFGPTSLVDGARAYTASAKAATTVAGLEADMPELRKMSPAEFNKYTAEKLLKANTGDATTDALVLSQMTQRLPSFMQAQAKNHLAYQNEMLADSIGADQLAKATLLGTLDSKARMRTDGVGPLPEGDVAADGARLGAELDLSASFSKPPPGMDKLTHQKITMATVAKSLSAGNFAAYDVLDKSGQLDQLELPIANAMRTAYKHAQAEARMALPVEFSRELADLGLAIQRGADTAEITTRTQKLNKGYTQHTGDPALYRDAADLARDMLRSDMEYAQEQARLQKLRATATGHAQKEAVAVEEIQGIAVRITEGKPVPGATEEQKRVAWVMAEQSNPGAIAYRRVQGIDVDNPDKQFGLNLESSIGGALRATRPEDVAKGVVDPKAQPAMLHRAYLRDYLPLVKADGDKGEAAAQFYAGKYKGVMARYHAFFAGRNPESLQEDHMIAAYTVAVNEVKPAPSTKEQRAEGVAFLTKNPWFAAYMPAKNADALYDILSPHLNTALAVETAVPVASRTLPNLKVIGGYHWWLPAGAKDFRKFAAEQRSTNGVSHGRIVKEEEDRAFDYSVGKLAKEAGFKEIAGVYQGEDADGVPQFLIQHKREDDRLEFITLPASKVLKDWTTDKQANNWLSAAPKSHEAVKAEYDKLQRGLRKAQIR